MMPRHRFVPLACLVLPSCLALGACATDHSTAVDASQPVIHRVRMVSRGDGAVEVHELPPVPVDAAATAALASDVEDLAPAIRILIQSESEALVAYQIVKGEGESRHISTTMTSGKLQSGFLREHVLPAAAKLGFADDVTVDVVLPASKELLESIPLAVLAEIRAGLEGGTPRLFTFSIAAGDG